MKNVKLLLAGLLIILLSSGCNPTESDLTIINSTTVVDIDAAYIVPAGTDPASATNQLSTVIYQGQSGTILGITDCDINIDVYLIDTVQALGVSYTNLDFPCGGTGTIESFDSGYTYSFN